MKTKYPSNKYRITYEVEEPEACSNVYVWRLWGPDGEYIDSHDISGRELGRDAWDLGADEVCYDYDLGLDEHVPLIPRHEKYKART